MAHTFFDQWGNRVSLTFDRSEYKDAGYVLVFAFYHGQLVFVRHVKRGWELPGGTREPNELEMTTAVRETYEESGAILDGIDWVGQYSIVRSTPPIFIKSVYVARVREIQPLPPGFETTEVQLTVPPSAEAIQNDAQYSDILKDQVYPLTVAELRRIDHPFIK